MIKNIAIIIVLILTALDIMQVIKDMKKTDYSTSKVFPPVWAQKIIPFIVSICAYALIIYAIIL